MKYAIFTDNDNSALCHYQVKGAKHGVRRYQNPDGSLTPLGREHYGVGDPREARKHLLNSTTLRRDLSEEKAATRANKALSNDKYASRLARKVKRITDRSHVSAFRVDQTIDSYKLAKTKSEKESAKNSLDEYMLRQLRMKPSKENKEWLDKSKITDKFIEKWEKANKHFLRRLQLDLGRLESVPINALENALERWGEKAGSKESLVKSARFVALMVTPLVYTTEVNEITKKMVNAGSEKYSN